MLEETIDFCLKNPSSTVKDIRFVLYKENSAILAAFQQEMANFLSTQKLSKPKVSPRHAKGGLMSNLWAKLRNPRLPENVTRTRVTKVKALDIEVIKGDLTQEKTDAIMNINSTDMDMTKAGALSKAIRIGGGLQLQQECSQLGQQTPGSAVMTSGGGLAVKHIIHIIPGSADTNHLQKCLEVGLDLADTNNLQSISIPCVGTGGFGLDGAESAQLTFQALEKFREHCKSIRKVRIVVFLDGMMQDFVQAQQTHAVEQDADEPDRRASSSSGGVARQLRKRRSRKTAANDYCLKICVVSNDQAKVQKAVDSLKKGFSESITSDEIEDDTISRLSQKQIDTLTRKAEERDVKLDIEVHSERIALQGETSEVLAMVKEISREIKERSKKIQEEEKLLLVSKNVEWSYEINKVRTVVDPDTNKKIEEAYSKRKDEVKVSLGGEKFVLNLKENTGQSRKKGKKSEHKKLKLFRKVKPLDEGIPLSPKKWALMPRTETVHTVKLSPGSGEYQNVLQKVKATASGINIQKIERVQNPHLYQSYMVRKEKMDKDKKGNNEQQLFHGTNADNVAAINTQGFNRSLCGVHGTKFGQGVYFARDASYSVYYAVGEACRQMYLARVLVGQYCQGDPSMRVPPPKDPSRPEILYESVVDDIANPSIFVVFYDNQCYPEYLITFS